VPQGKGYQTSINDALREYVPRHGVKKWFFTP
jgi:uncharacterized protein (DUF4415 family)